MPPPHPTPTHAIDIREESGVRYLHFGSEWVQGAMRIARPWALELTYTQEMMACLLFQGNAQWPRSALLIGLGAASLTRFIYRHFPQCQLTVVEINPGVVAAARQFFKLPEDPRRLSMVLGDGADFIASNPQSFDLILVDGFDANARCGQLTASTFYSSCRERLTPEGMLVCNLLGRNRGFDASVNRLRTAFDGRVIVFPSGDSGNAVAFATPSGLSVSLPEMRARAEQIKNLSGLNLAPAISRIQLTQSVREDTLSI